MRSIFVRLGLACALALLGACNGGGGDTPAPVPPTIATQPQSAVVNQGQSATFTVSANGTAPLTYQWRRGGAAVAGGTGAALTLSSAQPGDAGSYDVVVSNSAGTATSSAATLAVNLPPAITVQPQGQVVLAPAAATFSVTASGTAPLAYQWKRNGADIAGATASAFSTAATGAADDGALYSVSVSNIAGTVASASATLTVHVAAAVTAQPQAQAVIAPAAATFSVAAAGTAPLSYQWRRNGSAIAGATGPSYTTPATSGADSGALFSVQVGNAYGSDTSGNAALTVNLPPAISTQPANQAVVAPATATFSVLASGTAPLSYQWRKNGVDIAGAVAAAYSTPATSTADHGSVFSVVVSSPYGSLTSSNATLSVTAAPVAPAITVHPSSQTVLAPAPASFSVAASGTAPLSYQWRLDGAPIAGATGSSFTTGATILADNGSQYTVTVTNSVGSATSNPATLTVNAGPSIQVQPASKTVTAPATATFNVIANGTAPLSYQWKKGSSNVGTNAASYTTPATTTGDSGSTYSVVVSNAYGTVTSGTATLTVSAAPALDLTVPTVYISQATQTQAFNVPLVQDRNGYLRAFVVANQANTATPRVRVRIYNSSDVLQSTLTITAPGTSVPTAVDESSLSNSWNVAIPAAQIQPGNKLLVDVDDNNAVAEGSESNNTWPSTGVAQSLDVRTLNPFRVTFLPVQTGDARTGNVNSGLLASYTSLLEKIWPINNATDRAVTPTFSVTDVLGAQATWSSVLGKVDAKRTADGVSNRYYYGVVNPSYSGGIAGLGYLGWPVAIGWDKSAGYSDSGQYPGVYAHETGHNFNLNHAPCGGAGGPDPGYPYAGGLIGAWGNDNTSGALKNPATWTDIMGYCSTVWVSDYNYKKVLANRQGSLVPIVIPAAGDPAAPRSLLLWGRLDDGVPLLQPAFHMAVDALPPEPGDQLLEGFDATGAKLFATSFSLTEVGCVPMGTASHFSFSLPVTAEQAARLSELRWTKAGEPMAQLGGPSRVLALAARSSWEPVTQVLDDGRTRLLWDAATQPMVMVRDRATGLVLGFGEGGDFRFQADAEELEYHFSNGLRSHSAVVRRPRLGE